MLNDTKIKKIKSTGKEQRILDSLGLYLRVDKYGNKTWQLRYVFDESKYFQVNTPEDLKNIINEKSN